MEKNEILKKALDNIDDEDNYFETCLNGKICPKCGKDLFLKLEGTCNIWSTSYKCNCGFFTSRLGIY